MNMNILCRVDCCEDEDSARMLASCILGDRVASAKFGKTSAMVINNKEGKRVCWCPANEFASFVDGCQPSLGADLMGIHALGPEDYAPGDCVYLVVVEASLKL